MCKLTAVAALFSPLPTEHKSKFYAKYQVGISGSLVAHNLSFWREW